MREQRLSIKIKGQLAMPIIQEATSQLNQSTGGTMSGSSQAARSRSDTISGGLNQKQRGKGDEIKKIEVT